MGSTPARDAPDPHAGRGRCANIILSDFFWSVSCPRCLSGYFFAGNISIASDVFSCWLTIGDAFQESDVEMYNVKSPGLGLKSSRSKRLVSNHSVI